MNIYITRHSKTIWNEEKRLQGRNDSALTQEGIENAEALKTYISHISFDEVYSSPINRAYKTACLIVDQPVIKDDRLMEMDFGIFEGRKIADILKTDYELYHHMWHQPELFERIPKGESYEEVMERVESFFGDLRNRKANNVLVVTHGMVFITILAYMLHIEKKDYPTINQKVVDGCSLTLFKEKNGQYKKVFIGKNEFLPHISNEVFSK